MNENQDSKKKWIDLAVKLALSLAMLFPCYALFYFTFPASLLGLYLLSAALVAIFAPWEDLKKKFLS